jgi:hypothetical protein
MKLCDNCEFRTLQDHMQTCARCLEPFVARDETVEPGSIAAAAAKLDKEPEALDAELISLADVEGKLPEPKPKPKPKKAAKKTAKKTTKGK